ncbi:MAG TPA: discoidin domain-containing protein, partial [Gemmatimonadales bacterium]|nr:discoidin domain-containing protein [Gemmatimonadales bacterium]
MTVLYRSSSVQMNVAGTNQNSITVTKPSATAEGDVMIAVTTQPSTTTTPPSGWTLLGSFTEAGNQEANVYRKIAGSSEPANYTWTFGSSSTCGVAIASFLGGHDVLLWDSRTNTATSVPFGRQLNAARDAVAWTVLSWRDTATSTFTPGQGVEKFDAVSNNTGATIFRGLTAAYYGPPDVNDIVNIGDGLPGTLFTSSGGALTEAFVIGLLISEKEPDNETWSSTNGDFGVELKLDQVDLNATGGISTPFRGDVTNSVTAFLESGESAPNVTENLADGLTTTRWLTNGDSGYVTYDFGSGNPKTIKRYRLTSASSSAERDPMNWTLEGSNDNSSFTVLDTRSNEGFANRSETNEFRVTTTGSYRYYKLNISSNQDPATATAVHLAEFRLSTHDVWEDVTSYVQEESKIRITRGLQGSSGRSDFSRAYVELRNTDGRFSIRNQDGAYFGSLQRNSQMRISKAYGTKALQLQGDVQLEGTDMCGDCARTPLTDVLSILGDIDVRIDLEPESWRDEQMLAGVAP